MINKTGRFTLVGVDGCPGGWLAVIVHPRRALAARVFATFADLVESVGASARIGIDIPIGLPEKGARQCELDARQLLGRPRMSSVFPVPPRACLRAESYDDACLIRYEIDGKKMSKQAYGILPKIREVDEYLTAHSRVASRVVEVHPELSFATWNRNCAMVHNKKNAEGKAERRRLIDKVWPGQMNRLRGTLKGEDYALDDLHDAIAALWSVRRWVADEGDEVGDIKARDGKGLGMRMVV